MGGDVSERETLPDTKPASSAARASSRWTVGSSPKTSSPTSAAATAARIAVVGR